MTAFIAERFGTAMAFDVSTLFVHDAARHFGEGRGPGHLNGPETPELHAAINHMVDTIGAPEPLADVASAAGVSLRTMHRQFLSRLGMPPGRYYQSLRLARARDLAETTDLSVQELAVRTGFSMPSTLSRAYRTHFGASIRDVRTARRRGGASDERGHVRTPPLPEPARRTLQLRTRCRITSRRGTGRGQA